MNAPSLFPDDEAGALRERWLELTRRTLPNRATSEPGWPVRHDHCFMRIGLDNALGRPWRRVLTGRGPAYRQLTAEQMRAAVAVAERMAAGGPGEARRLNCASLALRASAG